MKDKLTDFIEKNHKTILILLFVLGILIYGYIARQMTTIAHIGNDEELYINIAKSFFNEGNFQHQNKIVNYNCVVYSMIISIAYLFYSPENILFYIRLIGVIMIVSSVFPVYLLSKKVLNSKVKAILIAGFNLIIPEMGLSMYAIQEVLLYPLFLWTVYLIYLKFKENDSKIINIAIILLLAIMFFVKSYAISFGIAYFITLIIIYKKNGIKDIIIYGVIYLITIGLGYFIIYEINDFQVGSNHYSSQISSIFPITLNTIKNLLYGIFYYTILCLFCSGIAPVLYTVFNINKYEKTDKNFIYFLIISAIATIVEIATIVFIPEESDKLYPGKVCYRYLFVLSLPFLIMFIKLKNENIKTDKKIIIFYVIILAYIIWYNIGKTSTFAIIDAPVLVVMNHLYTNTISMITVGVFILLSIFILSSKKDIKKTCIIVLASCSIIFNIQYLYLCIFNSNYNIGGKKYEQDIGAICENIEDDAKVYLYACYSKSLLYCRTISAYIKTQCYIYEKGDIIDVNKGEKAYFIIPSEYYLGIENFEKIDLDTTYLDIYVYVGED